MTGYWKSVYGAFIHDNNQSSILCIYNVTFLEKILECMNLLMRNIGIGSVNSVVS